MNEMKKFATLAAMAVVGLIVLVSVFGSAYTIDEGERGVIVTNGVVKGTAEPGFHFKKPIITSISTVPTRTLVAAYQNLEAYTADQQIATVEGINVTYRIPTDRVEDVYRDFKTPDAVVDRFVGRRINAVLETVFGQFNAETSIQKRGELSAKVSSALKDVPSYAPIEILSVELTSLSYPPEYNQRINDRMASEVEVGKKIQEVRQAEQDRLKAQQQADAQAYATRAAAQAKADAVRLAGEAEADAIRAKAKALADNPSLIELTKAERWDGVLPTSMVPGSTVPFMNVK